MNEIPLDTSPVYYDPDNVVHDSSDFENIPAELCALPQWVLWKLETVDGRLTKVPYTAAGGMADSTDPQTWATFELCRAALRSSKFFGLGFVFADGGGLTGIDLDKHRDPATGELDAFAAEYVSRLNSYAETSQSDTGVHIIARATIPGDKGRRDAKSGVEMYSKARFFVMTGKHIIGSPRTVEPRQQAVAGMFREIFPPKEKLAASKTAQVHTLTLTDHDLISKASQAKNGAQFSALWCGNFAAAGYGSQSEADAAFLSMLYFWTGGDKGRAYSLFTQSGLNREKWQREDYRESTWQLVAHGETYSPEARTPQQPATVAGSTAPNFDAVTADVRGEIVRILTDSNFKGTNRNREVAKIVTAELVRVGKLYFHAERRDFDSAMFFDASAKRLWRICSDAFTAWLSHWVGINRADPLFKFIFAEVETAALSTDTATGIVPESFWAARPGAIYISNGDGHAAKITAESVRLVDNGTDGVLFSAGRTLQSWKIESPKDIFQTCEIFRNARCAARHGLDLVRLWIYSLPTTPRSKPPLCLPGEIGSGKTRLAKAIAEFFGIPFIAAKVEESEESNFWPSVDAGGMFTLDNADTKCRWLADALANAATDGCTQRRKLYTNAETVTLRARAWLCVTTANPTFASDAGLADRLLLVRMARRDGETTSDAGLTDEILANRDAGLSHLAETLRAALADTAPTPDGLNRRHPDFAAFAVRIGRALGREAEAVAALKQAEADKSAFCLENDNIGTALLAYLRTAGSFTGTASELVPHLVETDGELAERLSAKRLAKRLSAIWPHLQSALAMACKETDRKGFLVFRFKSAEIADFQMPFSQNPSRE